MFLKILQHRQECAEIFDNIGQYWKYWVLLDNIGKYLFNI